MLSSEHRCVFVHIPKTGGTSVEVALTGYDWIVEGPEDYAVYLREQPHYRPDWGGELCARDPAYFSKRMAIKHASQRELAEDFPEEWRRWLKFTFVRNPWERTLAIWRHGRRDAPARTPESFREWILRPEPADHMGQPVFQPLVTDWDELDFVGRFEDLAQDFERLCARLGIAGLELPHVSHGSQRVAAAAFFDDLTAELVAVRCAEEIERFGYAFPGTARAA